MVIRVFSVALLVSIFLGFPGVALAAQNADFLVNEDQGIVVARFAVKMLKENEKHPADVYEFLRFFGITMSQEQLIEKKSGRSLYKIFQKNILGEKSEFHELRWQDGDYFIVAGVLNSSAESLTFLKALPQNPWAGRKTANAETEAGICPTCESSKFMRPIDDWVKSAREWVAVDCQADKADGRVTGGKILSAVGSCLRGVALSVVDIAKLVYDLLSTQIKLYSDPHYAVAFTRVIWEAVKNPSAFLQNLFSMFWQAAKDTYGKFKGCNMDYQTGLVCQLLVDFLVPGGAIVKGIKLTARGARGAVGAVGAIRAAATAEAKVIAEAAPKATARAVDEVALSVRTTSEGLEYTATAGGKEAARVTSEEVASHLDDMVTPTDDILKAEVGAADELRDLASAVGDELAPGKFSSRRREIEETLRELQRAESVDKTNRLAKLLVEEMKSKGIKAKIVYSRDLLAKGAREIINTKIAGVEKNIAGYRQELPEVSGFQKERLQKALGRANSDLAKLKAELKGLDAPNVAVRIEVDMSSQPVLASAKAKSGVSEIVIPLERLHKPNEIAGYLQVATHQIGLGIDNVLNPKGIVSGVLYHEIHHSAKEALVEKANALIRRTMDGPKELTEAQKLLTAEERIAAAQKLIPSQEYPFLGTARSTPGQTVTSFNGYTTYFASDEVPAYARSLAYAMRGLENTTRVTERAVLRTPPDLKAFDVAGKLKNAAQSNLDLVKLMQDRLRTHGMSEVHVTSGTANQVPTVVMPLYRGKIQIGEYTFHPLALQKEFRMSSQKIVEDFLSRMEAASRAHLREAERVLALKPADLKKEIEMLTRRSRGEHRGTVERN